MFRKLLGVFIFCFAASLFTLVYIDEFSMRVSTDIYEETLDDWKTRIKEKKFAFQVQRSIVVPQPSPPGHPFVPFEITSY